MSRTNVYKDEGKGKQLNPIWRGVGCITVVVVFSLSFWLSSLFIDYVTSPESKFPWPTFLKFAPSAIRGMQAQFRGQFRAFGIGQYIVPFILSLVVALLVYGIISAIYATFRGNINDPRDVRDYQPSGRKKRNVRKCR